MQFYENTENLREEIAKLTYDHHNKLETVQILSLLNKYSEVYQVNWYIQEESAEHIWFAQDSSFISIELKRRAMEPEFLILLQELIYVADKTIQQIRYRNGDFNCYYDWRIANKETEGLIRCGNCGNVWDGNAQCMCNLD